MSFQNHKTRYKDFIFSRVTPAKQDSESRDTTLHLVPLFEKHSYHRQSSGNTKLPFSVAEESNMKVERYILC